MRKLIWTLVVLVVLVVLLDRGADYAAERVVADQVRSSQHLESQPDVDIAGFPFLTQFAAGKYDHISATTDKVSVGKPRLVLSDVRIDFRDVTTSRDFKQFAARTGTARATISYASLSDRLGVTVKYADNGRIRASKSFDILGAKIEPTIQVKPEVANGALKFAGSTINGLQDAPARVTDALQSIFNITVPLDGLPFDVKVSSVMVDEQGLELKLTGKDLRYPTADTGS